MQDSSILVFSGSHTFDFNVCLCAQYPFQVLQILVCNSLSILSMNDMIWPRYVNSLTFLISMLLIYIMLLCLYQSYIGSFRHSHINSQRVCERDGTSQLFLRGPTDRNIQFVSKLDRKHCRMLVGLPTGHTNLYHMLHNMRRAKNTSCRRCGTEKEMFEHVLCECLVLEKIRKQTVGFTGMDPDQIKEARLSILAFGKRAGMLNSPYKFK